MNTLGDWIGHVHAGVLRLSFASAAILILIAGTLAACESFYPVTPGITPPYAKVTTLVPSRTLRPTSPETSAPSASAQESSMLASTKTRTPTVTPKLSPTHRATATQTPPDTPTPSPTATLPPYAAAFVADVTIPDGSVLPAGQEFDKTWAVRNTGTATWDQSVRLRNLNNPGEEYDIPNAAPGDVIEITVPFVAPVESGNYIAELQLWADGRYFGPRLYSVIAINAPVIAATSIPTQAVGYSAACVQATAYLQYIQSYCSDRRAALLARRDVQALAELQAWCEREIQYAASLQSAYCAP